MSMFERALHGLDIDPDYVDAIVGDLTEERALRAECDGVFGARLWYIREIVRSAPHVIVTLLRHVG